MQLLDNINKNELLDKIGSDAEMLCKERDNKIEGDKKNTFIIGS